MNNQRPLEDADAMAQAITTHHEAPSGLLRLCSDSGFGRHKLARALAALAKHYLQLELQLGLLDRPVFLVGEGFHLDIRLGQLQEPHLITRRIAQNQRVLGASPAMWRSTAPPKPCRIWPSTNGWSSANATWTRAAGR